MDILQKSKNNQRRIGLTGGIASGKTTITNYIKKHKNIPILDADHFSRELISIARTKPEALLIISSQISIHEARTIDWVNIPLKILPFGASISAKSFLLEAFNPADIPAKRNPLGVTLLSSTNDQLETNWLKLFGILIYTNYSLILKKLSN